MPHANGTTNGTAKRGVNQKPLNGSVGVDQATALGDKKTDRMRWRLKDDRGCQTWHYLKTDEEIKAWPQSVADRWFLGMDTVRLPETMTYTKMAHWTSKR